MLVVGVERRSLRHPVERDQDAAGPVAEAERDDERRAWRRRRSARARAPCGWTGSGTTLRCAARIDGAGQGPLHGSVVPTTSRRHLAGGGLHAQGVALLEQHEQRARLRHRASALDDQLEHPARARSRSPTARAIAAVASRPRTARSSSARRRCDVLVQARVVDRDCRPLGRARPASCSSLLGELLSAGLVGQVEVAVGLPANGDRHAEEGRHRRVAGGKPYERGCSVTSCSRSGSGSRISSPSTPWPRGSGPIDPARLLVDSDGEEALELALALVEDAQRRVARAGQLASRLEHAGAAPTRGRARPRAHGRPPAACSSSLLAERLRSGTNCSPSSDDTSPQTLTRCSRKSGETTDARCGPRRCSEWRGSANHRVMVLARSSGRPEGRLDRLHPPV